MAYNASYQSAVGNAPFSALFAKVPVLPGMQSLATTEGKETREGLFQLREARSQLAPFLEPVKEESDHSKESEIKPGRFVLFLTVKQSKRRWRDSRISPQNTHHYGAYHQEAWR
eukprot:GHVN01088415.1.p1 GENE.GHVN01088415.1~~GHVN01088415.1.p1  ORF type:complete len:114 (+),score=10.29 GHVN01088415.1:395-736(+)